MYQSRAEHFDDFLEQGFEEVLSLRIGQVQIGQFAVAAEKTGQPAGGNDFDKWQRLAFSKIERPGMDRSLAPSISGTVMRRRLEYLQHVFDHVG